MQLNIVILIFLGGIYILYVSRSALQSPSLSNLQMWQLFVSASIIYIWYRSVFSSWRKLFPSSFQSADPDSAESGPVFQTVGHGGRGSQHVHHDEASAEGEDGDQVG